MGKTHVPELARKLDLLTTYGIFPDRPALAKALGFAVGSLKWWVYGDPARGPNHVTGPGMTALLGLFASLLPEERRVQAQTLLLGPADDLELIFAPTYAENLMSLIRAEAITDEVTLHRGSTGALSLVQTSKAPKTAAHYEIKRSQAFRLSFKTRLKGRFVVAFQKSPGSWGIVPSDAEAGTIHVPGRMEDGALAEMWEDNETGRHTFIVAQSTKAFPAQLLSAEIDEVQLDRSTLGFFAADFRGRPKTTRALFSVEIDIVD